MTLELLVPEIQRGGGGSALLRFKLNPMFMQPSKHFPDRVNMILKCLAKYNDVINERYTYTIPQTIKAVLHKVLIFSG